MCNIKKKIHLSRREALALMGAAGAAPIAMNSAMDVIIGSMVDGLFRKAQAQTTTTPPRNLVHLDLGGGAPRYYWDLPLADPYQAGQTYAPNPMVKTNFKNIGGTSYDAQQMEYQVVPVTRAGVTLHMPYLWSLTIPTANNGPWILPHDLLTNMLIVRGVNLKVDGHSLNGRRQLRPLNSRPSIDGMVVDGVSTPIPAVSFNGHTGFRSGKGIGRASDYATSNGLNNIMSPFNRSKDPTTGSAYMSRRMALDAAISRSLAGLRAYADSANPGAGSLFDVRNTAEAFMRKGYVNIAGYFPGAEAKYQALIDRIAQSPMIGINDKAIPSSTLTPAGGIHPGSPQASVHEGYAVMSDYSKMIQYNVGGLRSSLGRSQNGLAAKFAAAEYMLVNGYSSSVSLGDEGPTELNIGNLMDRDVPTLLTSKPSYQVKHDQHFVGSVVALIATSFYFRCLSACLYEFIQTLKAAGLFDETVIQFGGEFGRDPNGTDGGSQHGWMSTSNSFFSGAIKQPLVVGNTVAQVGGKTPGSWGKAAPTVVGSSVAQELTLGHLTSTAAELLRVSPIMTNNETVVKEAPSGGLVLNADKAKGT